MAEEEKGDIWARRALDGHRERKENQLLAATESANIALKGLLLLNGGAAIALLAFLANVVKEEATSAAAQKLVFSIHAAMGSLAYGAAAAVGAAMFGYLTNRAYAECIGTKHESLERPYLRETCASKLWGAVAGTLNVLGVLSAAASLYFFVIGVSGVQIR
ncbi:hypothetical protein [Ancylobacter sp.]|uniref:hypothetical protein n=1 Tax=Ancylobacter sp. TaxID=1872567 RepID=UPI003BAA713A